MLSNFSCILLRDIKEWLYVTRDHLFSRFLCFFDKKLISDLSFSIIALLPNFCSFKLRPLNKLLNVLFDYNFHHSFMWRCCCLHQILNILSRDVLSQFIIILFFQLWHTFLTLFTCFIFNDQDWSCFSLLHLWLVRLMMIDTFFGETKCLLLLRNDR